MQDTLNSNATTSLRRRSGPVGGVLSGIGHSVGVDATVLRVGTAIAGLVLGPVIVLAYLGAWMLIPVDESLPSSQRPSSVPRVLLGVVAAIIAIQVVFGLITSLPFTWLVLGGIAAYWLFIKD